MENILIAFLALILGSLVSGFFVWFFVRHRLSDSKDDFGQSFVLLQNQLSELVKTVDEKMGHSNRDMQAVVREQFGESQKLIRDITEKVTKVEESSRQVFTVAEALQNLEKVLKHQKQRGNLGEAGLELI